MKRVVASLTAVLIAGAGLTMAAPAAQASDAPPWPLNCGIGAPERPPLGTVSIDSEGLHINTDAPASDIDAQRDWAVAWSLHLADCFTSRVPTEHVFCYTAIAQDIGSYVNVNPPQIDVYYPALVAAIADCTFSS